MELVAVTISDKSLTFNHCLKPSGIMFLKNMVSKKSLCYCGCHGLDYITL